MAADFEGVINNLKGYFGGTRRTPEQKVGELGGLFNRLSAPGPTPPDPNNLPSPQQVPQPAPEPAPVQEPPPEAPQSLDQVLLPEQPQIDLNQLIQQAIAEQQMKESLLASLLMQPQGLI